MINRPKKDAMDIATYVALAAKLMPSLWSQGMSEPSAAFVLMRGQVAKALRAGLEQQRLDPKRDFAMAGSGDEVLVSGTIDLDGLAAVIAKHIVP